MSVFISHSSKDKPAVEALAAALGARGIEVWLDKWEIGPGDDIVAKINEGLDKAGAASSSSPRSPGTASGCGRRGAIFSTRASKKARC